jgi:hypothetical protein
MTAAGTIELLHATMIGRLFDEHLAMITSGGFGC